MREHDAFKMDKMMREHPAQRSPHDIEKRVNLLETGMKIQESFMLNSMRTTKPKIAARVDVGDMNGGNNGAKIRDITRVDHRITDVERKVDVIESRAGAQSAVFGGIPLRSKLDCEKFVAQYLPGGVLGRFL